MEPSLASPERSSRPSKRSLWRIAGIAALLSAALAAPEQALPTLRFVAVSLWETAPVILLGVVLTAAATASGAMSIVARRIEGSPVRAIVLVSFVGALTPVCGLSVLPLIAGLLAGGVPLAPVMAFWLSSPITDPGMLAITAGTLGLPFAVAKTVAAFGIGVSGGLATLLLTQAGALRDPVRAGASWAKACGRDQDGPPHWRFWNDRARLDSFRTAALFTLRLMLCWLALAFAAEYLLRLYLPEDLVASVVGDASPWAVPLAAAFGAPIYLDGYAALPLIRGLIDSGMRPDAAMAFLVSGGIISAWAAIPVFALVRLPVFLFYAAAAVLGAMLAGWLSGPFLS